MPVVEVPNRGKIEFPEGMSDDDISAAIQHITRNDPAPVAKVTDGMGTGERLLAGVGSGIKDIYQNGGNIGLHVAHFFANPHLRSEIEDALANSPSFGDNALADKKTTDEDLASTGAGAAGKFAGQVLATLPLGGAGSAVAKALGAGRLAAGGLAATLARGGAVGVDGGLQGAILGDPNDRVNSAEKGAAGGVLLGGGLGVGKRLLNGLVEKSTAAQDLIRGAQQMGSDIAAPISQIAKKGMGLSGTIGWLYRNGVGLLPGGAQMLEKQGNDAQAAFRLAALKASQPEGGVVSPNAGFDPLNWVNETGKRFDREYDRTLGGYTFNVPTDFHQRVLARIRSENPNINSVDAERIATELDQHMAQYSDGAPTIDSANLLNARRAAGRLFGDPTITGPAIPALHSATKAYDDIIESELGGYTGAAGKKAQADLDAYQALKGPYANYAPVRAAAELHPETRGQFSPAELARTAKPESDLLKLSQDAHETIGQPAAFLADHSMAHKIAAGIGLTGAAATGHIPALLTAGAVGVGAATKPVQRALLGDTALQQYVAEALRNNPRTAGALDEIFRNAAVTAGDKQNE